MTFKSVIDNKFIYPGPEIVHPDDVLEWLEDNILDETDDLFHPREFDSGETFLYHVYFMQSKIIGFDPIIKYQKGAEMHYYF